MQNQRDKDDVKGAREEDRPLLWSGRVVTGRMRGLLSVLAQTFDRIYGTIRFTTCKLSAVYADSFSCRDYRWTEVTAC